MDKINVKIFLPASSCTCNYSDFLIRVDKVLSKYREHLHAQVISSHAPEAAQYGLQYLQGLVINGTMILGPSATETQIENAILKELNHLQNPK